MRNPGRTHARFQAARRQRRAALQPISHNIRAHNHPQNVTTSSFEPPSQEGAMPSKKSSRASPRALPSQRNPLLAAEETPEHHELIKTRRLGRTNLEVKPEKVGLTNATKPEVLGNFDYSHIRAPLPKDLKGSSIFAPAQHQHPPESYFLMRRSQDGYVSATGMFKAAFPWATHDEENAEKEHLRELEDAATNEVAGNVWVAEHMAIELADEYGIKSWIIALLDPAAIAQDAPGKPIPQPPKYKFTAGEKPLLPAPNGTPKSRGRPRGSSPSKSLSPVKASAKKPRETKKQKEATAREASEVLQATLKDAVAAEEKTQQNGDKVKVDVETTTQAKGNTETTTTNVKIEMPKGSPELPLPENPEQMIETAKKMVDEAKKLDKGGRSGKGKRKADELEEEAEGDPANSGVPPVKRAKVAEEKLKRERVRNRALVGVAATLAIGAIIPYFT